MSFMTDQLGVYIGDASRDEALSALSAHDVSEWVVGVEDADDVLVVQVSGFGNLAEPDSVRLTTTDGEPAGMFAVPRRCGVERWTGGFRLRLDAGVTLSLVRWDGVMHVTDSGDLAPGLPS